MLKVKLAKPTGGKAGKGRNKTSVVQILNTDISCIVKQFRFYVGDAISKMTAIKKAKKYILGTK